VWGEPTDPDVVTRTLEHDVPDVLDYLEAQLPAEGYVFGDLSVADVAIACFFRNAAFARFRVDAARWPITAAFVERVLGIPAFQRLMPFEDRTRRTPIPEQREALIRLGAPIMSETDGPPSPGRGIMQI